MIEIAHWHDPESPLRIEYSRQAMEQIRLNVVEGIKALPRTGLSVGGLLLGERAGARVRILDSVELECSHAFGPSFLLTPEEKAQARKLIQATENPAVVGWYCSHTRGDLALADADLALYRELFPAQWQITLMLLGDLDGPARAAFFFSSKQDALTKGTEQDLHTWIPGISELEPEEPMPMELPEPAFHAAAAKPASKSNWIMSWVLTAIAALAVGAAAFEVQNTWLTETPAQPPAQAQVQQVP
jgi:proteasome lid subunit RPN8/RPN11